MRNTSDILFKSIISFLSLKTGLPKSGKDRAIVVGYPDDFFVNERTAQKYPTIAVYETGKSKIEYLNYGCKQVTTQNSDGSFIVYTPIGRKTTLMQIDLWCETIAQRNIYKSIIEEAIVATKFLQSEDDPVSDEIIPITFSEYWISEQRPYVASFVISTSIRLYSEDNNWLVDDVNIYGAIGEELTISNNSLPSGNLWMSFDATSFSVTGDVKAY